MNTEQKASELTAYGKLLDTMLIDNEERKVSLDGCSILLDLDWPSNYIDAKKCKRANQGLVPRYEGFSSLADYAKRWWPEDQILPAHSAPVPRTLKFHARVDDVNQKTCSVWIEDNRREICEKSSGMTVRDIQDFFMKHPSLMLGGHPYDFSTWLVNGLYEEVSIADDLAAYRELGLKITANENSAAVQAPSHQNV